MLLGEEGELWAALGYPDDLDAAPTSSESLKSRPREPSGEPRLLQHVLGCVAGRVEEAREPVAVTVGCHFFFPGFGSGLKC